MKTIQALDAAVQALLVEHKTTRIPDCAYEDLAIDLGDYRGNSDDAAAIARLVDSTALILEKLRTLDLAGSRAFEETCRTLDAVRNELRGPAVGQMADALLAAVRARDQGAMADDIDVNGVRTFAIDAMIDADTMGRLLLEAAERILK